MKQIRVIFSLSVGLLFAAALIAPFFETSPVDVAKSYCVRNGTKAEDLAPLGFTSSGNFFVTRETVSFQVKPANPEKKIVVELRRMGVVLPWQVVGSREEGSKS